MNAIIDALDDANCERVIADTTEIPPLDQDDQVWSVEDWSPRAEDAGLKHLGMVMPESVIAEMSVDNIVEMADDTLNSDFFDDREEALEWAEEQTDRAYQRVGQ